MTTLTFNKLWKRTAGDWFVYSPHTLEREVAFVLNRANRSYANHNAPDGNYLNDFLIDHGNDNICEVAFRSGSATYVGDGVIVL